MSSVIKRFSQLVFASLTTLPLVVNASGNNNFTQCINNLQVKAKSSGYSGYIVNDIIPALAPIKRVIELDQRQPEFSQSFADYLKLRLTNYHIQTGRKKLAEHKELFDKLSKKYGIPAQYLVSFWGLETNFGRNKGKMSVLNSLATLACDERRSEYFTAELFDLFYLIDNKTITTKQLAGSWAGAMGHMQFMPSALKKYALDGDDDGKVDVWQSEADALTSAANYLNSIGWLEKERWGRQVQLPKNFAFQQVEFDQFYPLATFKALGVTRTNGSALSDYKIDAELVLPAGAGGPAFLVYPNFNVIMKWNLSENYALSVGLLANRIQGAAGLKISDKSQRNLYKPVELQALQKKLNMMGYNVGNPDGIWGPKSRKAIRLYQLQHGLVGDGFPSRAVLNKAGIKG
ncbi:MULTISPECIES: lytic murein transglycosylase [unclassified Colwellia]|uniref:lytic murein transglycosylase n=1 Tax=unclassified Colwellia TaxID=196834 RepID=UPI0015F76E4D|nr:MULTISPECIES: lytic murein transglycosylase [unclassified Colwellia]MBA6230703.1 lytic murein transglycosylase [Colwellia sp. MB02u-7]MBA6234634.1 lytic murein transglycosylase [Colwellia sp. MB02u-11]MBA6301188.1 lytic murein transglycosylase [Colwellia sp. MB3u-22]MBA6313076.1 lytic murein transglycosylase [Colwellia sp. MB3u-64]